MKLVKSVVCVALLVSFVLVGLSTPVVAQSVSLSPEEAQGLLYMWEEEKLARDVYTVLYETSGKRIFSNILASEQTHMDAVKGLLDHYKVENPAAGNDYGIFTNPDIRDLYNRLVEEGSESLAEALEVGVEIEETDIDDLTNYLGLTDKRDISRVYNNLLAGSRNHLTAFEYQLTILP